MLKQGEKVIYSFIHQAGFSPIEEDMKDQMELARKREGFFQRLAEVDIDGTRKCVAIIEDADTGELIQLEDQTLVNKITKNDI